MPAAIWAQRGAGGVEHGDGVGCREGEDVLDLGRVCGVYVCVAGVYGGDYDEGVHHAAFEESFSEGWWEQVRGLRGRALEGGWCVGRGGRWLSVCEGFAVGTVGEEGRFVWFFVALGREWVSGFEDQWKLPSRNGALVGDVFEDAPAG